MAEDIILTPSGKKKLEEELNHLRSTEMPALAERIRQARGLGDLSENFDYQDAKRQQGFVAGKIADLQAILDRARIVDEASPGDKVVGMGSSVTVRWIEFGDEDTFTLVGSNESDPPKISVSSPIGKVLMGRTIGEQVEVETPSGRSTLEILSVS